MTEPRWHLRHAQHGNRPWAVQAEALRRADGVDRYGYWLEQGLGKTALTLNEFIDRDDVDLCVVVAPQSFKLDWCLAPDEWGVDFLERGYWPKHDLPHDWEQGLYAVNYEAVSRSKRVVEALRRLVKDRRVMLVIDESKALGNPSSGWTKAVIELTKRAKVVRLLNGTPVTQSPMDLYGQLRALNQLNGWTSVDFRNRFAVLGGVMGRQVLPEYKNGEELAGILDRCSFRALKKDWRADLPPKTYSTVHLEMTDRQRQHYRTMMEEFYALVDGDDVTAEMVITQMGKLRQISSGILLDGKREYVLEDATTPKLTAAIELASGPGKTIVVHHHRLSGRLLIEGMRKAKLEPAYIQGGMKPEDITEQKRRFNDDPTCRALVGQERATALGHTLLGQPGDRCSRTVFFENSFSLYYRLQVEDRNHRGDQDEPCVCYDLVTSPMDAVVVKSLTAKKDMAASIDEVVAAVAKERQHNRRTK